MDRLLSVSQAARMVGIPRRLLQQHIQEGRINAFEGHIRMSELHKAYFSRIQDVVGLRAKRSVASGTTLHAGLLQRAKLIKRGGQVDIVSIIGGLQVRMRGKALADGGRGDRIQVENLSSGRVVSGTVVSSGVVHVLN